MANYNLNSIEGILKEYEDVLANEQANLPTIYFTHPQNKSVVKDFLRYVFSELMNWSPQDIYYNLTPDMVGRLKLSKAIYSLDFPAELDKHEDLWYVAHLLYPDVIPYDRDKYALKVYEDVLSTKLARLPKWFFTSFNGEINASLCLNYALSVYYPTCTAKELYEKFAEPQNVTEFLKRVRLMQACESFYDSPLDMLHDSLAEEDKDEYLYYYYKLRNAMKARQINPYIENTHADFDHYLNIRKAFVSSFNQTVPLVQAMG